MEKIEIIVNWENGSSQCEDCPFLYFGGMIGGDYRPCDQCVTSLRAGKPIHPVFYPFVD